MGPRRDVERFDRWAETYDSHWMQRRIFEPVQSTVLDLGQAMVSAPRAVLDVGCGTGRLLKAAASRFPDAELTGVDPAPEMVRHAAMAAGEGSLIQFREASAEALPFPDGQFELVFSTLTFHHWANQSRAIGEIARVLAPTGHWILADFLATGLMRPIRRLLRMNRFPERNRLDAMLAPAGLSVVSARPVAGLLGQVSALAIARQI